MMKRSVRVSRTEPKNASHLLEEFRSHCLLFCRHICRHLSFTANHVSAVSHVVGVDLHRDAESYTYGALA